MPPPPSSLLNFLQLRFAKFVDSLDKVALFKTALTRVVEAIIKNLFKRFDSLFVQVNGIEINLLLVLQLAYLRVSLFQLTADGIRRQETAKGTTYGTQKTSGCVYCSANVVAL